jgi:hypothetical protein
MHAFWLLMKLIFSCVFSALLVTALVRGRSRIQKLLIMLIYPSRFGVAFPDKKLVSDTFHFMTTLAEYIHTGNSLTDVLYGAYNPR